MNINETREADILRFNEIFQILNQIPDHKERKNMLEIGFRIPKIQSLFEENMKINTFGVDINNFNCELFSDLGYNVKAFDINKDENLKDLFNKKFDIVCCYHVIEHLENPFDAIKKIYSAMEDKGVLHVEIPIEGDNPQLEYGHLFGFMPGELGNILKEVGFNIVYATNNTHSGGSWIERYTVIKENKND